jgi:phage FluMu protein Com
MVTEIITDSVPCAVCGYPISAPTQGGQQVKCPWCSSINEAIAQVTIPTPLLVGILSFGAGVLLGPAFWAATKGGSEWLARVAREHIK